MLSLFKDDFYVRRDNGGKEVRDVNTAIAAPQENPRIAIELLSFRRR
jgi:hypothetical protein